MAAAADRPAGEPATRPFVIRRAFDAPRDLVFRAFTEERRLREWWGPKGFTVASCRVDLRPGGVCHYLLRAPDGSDMWGRMAYREVRPPERLVWVNSFSDEKGGVARHPGHEAWPLELLTTVTFTEEAGRTTVTVEWVPLSATEEERRTFDTNHDSMRGGWTGTLDGLAAYLGKG